MFLSGCTKSNDNIHWQAEITENRTSNLQDLFSQIGSEKLVDIIASKNEEQMSNYNKLKANQIASYFQEKYNVDIRGKFIDNPEGIVILGMFYAEKEYQEAKSKIRGNNLTTLKTGEENLSCLLAAVEGIIGVSQAKQIWKAILAGATEETVIAAVSLIGRRVATIWGVTIMVYQIGSCMEWW
jgi:hypothetical protein